MRQKTNPKISTIIILALAIMIIGQSCLDTEPPTLFKCGFSNGAASVDSITTADNIIALETHPKPKIYLSFNYMSDFLSDTIISISDDLTNLMIYELDQAFYGLIDFELHDNTYNFISGGYTIDEVFYGGLNEEQSEYFRSHTEDDVINVYVTRSDSDITGFTFMSVNHVDPDIIQGHWFLNSLFIGDNSFDDDSTIAHEVGHLFELNHVVYNGYNGKVACDNFMSYLPCSSTYTLQQLDTIIHNLINKREYLIK